MNFTLLQWNIRYSEDVSLIADFIKRLNPDALCLQELTVGFNKSHSDTGQYLSDVLGYHSFYQYGPMVLPDRSEARMGAGIFSRFPISDARRVVLQPGVIEHDHITQDERLYLHARIELPDVEVSVGTTHLPFHPRFRTSAIKQAMTDRILEEALNGDEKYILAGDMNATPRSKSALGLRKKLKHAGSNLNLRTWTTKPFKIGKYSYDELNYRLDYVLYRGPVRPVSASIIQTDLSDHLPIFVQFKI